MVAPTTAPVAERAAQPAGSRTRRWPELVILVIGLGLAAAPLAFAMFERAPKGGDMLDAFEPYMTTDEIGDFRHRLDQIEAARDEAVAAGITVDPDLAATANLDAQWAAIDADMGEMLDSMEANLDEYRGVAALPPFPLFPWFFVAPGLLLVAVTGASLLGRIAERPTRIALAALAVGLLAAPAVFQMFTRAPGGARMIADFEPMMTETRVASVQGYFLTIGAAEGELRRSVLPVAAPGDLPAVERFVAEWPAMSADMAPMIGTMADNVDNFAAVAALPPFGLFPWFFVLPGLIVLGLVWVDARHDDHVVDLTAQPLEGASA